MKTARVPDKTVRRFSLTKTLQESPVAQGLFLMGPTNTYLIVFMVIPLILVTVLSFLSRGTYGEVVYKFNLENYIRLFDTLYARILGYSLLVGFLTTLFSLVIGYPMAYYIARAPARQRSLLLFLILLPFWTNFIIRIYAWIMILRSEGFLNSFLQWAGIIHEPLNILYTPTAVLIGMVYEFLPFMVLPLYTSLEKIENAQLEAAADLGAPPWKAFLRVTLPLSVPGMIAGTILVFIPAMGMFVVPDLMGGAKTMLIGNVIRNQFLTARDWPFGAAASMLLMLLTMVFTLYYTRKAGFGEELLL
ncbi:MAG: ABC transporter permease [Anaerolineales bacterium]|jgi:spermidine/putrescine transport system permease protein|nr:ABC transporter permease [Anaerolineales bacterium]